MKKALALGAAAVIAAAALGGAAGYALHEPRVVTETVTNTVYEDVPGPQVEVEVIKEVTVYNETIVEVEDTDFIELACDRLFYEDLEECREEVEAEDVALGLAVDVINEDLFDYLDDEGLFGDEDDLEFVYVKDTFDDVEITESDFDGDEYTFEIPVKVEDTKEDEKKKFIVEVKVEDGEAEIIDAWEE